MIEIMDPLFVSHGDYVVHVTSRPPGSIVYNVIGLKRLLLKINLGHAQGDDENAN